MTLASLSLPLLIRSLTVAIWSTPCWPVSIKSINISQCSVKFCSGIDRCPHDSRLFLLLGLRLGYHRDLVLLVVEVVKVVELVL